MSDILQNIWRTLPPEARRAYASLADLAMELSPGAAVRDIVDASGRVGKGLLNLNMTETGLGAAEMAAAALGLIPGGRAGRLATGWTFRDVKHPHSIMQKGDWSRARPENAVEVDLPIRSMYATQNNVNPDFMSPLSGNSERPFVIKKGGDYYLQDGHHRVVRMAEEGKQTAPVRMVDLDGTTQTDFPLFEWGGLKQSGGQVSMSDKKKWLEDKRPRGAVSYTNADELWKVLDFNRNNAGPLRMTSKPPGPDIVKHASGGSVFGARARSGARFPQRRALRKADGGEVPGFFLGGLFGGGGGSQTSWSNSSTTQGVTDPNYNAMKDYVLRSGLDLIKGSQFTPYGKNPFVGLTPEQQRGIDLTSANVGNYSPFYGQAGTTLNQTADAFNPNAGQDMVTQAAGMQTGTGAASPFIQNGSKTFPGSVSEYMSPYTEQVVKGIQDASNRNFEQNTMRTINDTFSGGSAAQFGRQQHGNAVGNAVFAKTQADNAAVANALESGYSTAGQLFNQDQNRQLQAGQLSGSLAQGDIAQRAGLGQTAAGIQGTNTAAGTGLAQGQIGLGQNVQNSGLADSNALLQAGQVAQNTQQNQSNFDYNEFQQKQQYPFQLLSYGQGLSQGWQLPTQSTSMGSQTTQMQQPSGSPFGQIFGGLTSLAGLAVPGAGGASALGNIFGGIRGLFAEGGEVPYYAQGGMVPTVGQMRKSMNPNKGMVPTGMPGMPPMPPMAPGAPQPNGQMPRQGFRRGGRVSSPFCGAR